MYPGYQVSAFLGSSERIALGLLEGMQQHCCSAVSRAKLQGENLDNAVWETYVTNLHQTPFDPPHRKHQQLILPTAGCLTK